MPQLGEQKTTPNVILVSTKPGKKDAVADSLISDAREDLGIEIKGSRSVKRFSIDIPLSSQQLEQIKEIVTDPVTQESEINKEPDINFDQLAQISLKKGVTDTEGRTLKEIIADAERISPSNEEKVYTSTQYALVGVSKEEAERIAKGIAANTLIQDTRVLGREWDKRAGMFEIPRIEVGQKIVVDYLNLNIDDTKLEEIGRRGFRNRKSERLETGVEYRGPLSMNLREMHTIRDYYHKTNVVEQRRLVGLANDPTDVEIEVLGQTWSEHCKHKIFNARVRYKDKETGEELEIDSLFKTFVKGSTERIGQMSRWRNNLVSVFTDNAGAITFNRMYNIVMKVETHNSPSAKDPYGGAITGVNGVHRDVFGFGLGADMIASTDVLCFGNPFYDGYVPATVLHPRRVQKGVIKGIEHAGNKTGIPTINGSILYDDSFMPKPLVHVGAIGIIPKKINGKPSHIKKIDAGDFAVMIGGRVGKDGIHGATFSSETLHEGSPSSAVQIGDPIVQKRATDFMLKARDLGYYKAVTDNGAGGLSSSIGELAQLSGGCEIYLDKVPLKYEGLQPWEILISESQERMSLAVDTAKINDFLELAKKMRVEATIIGKFTDSNKFIAKYGERTVAHLDMDFLHNGVPRMDLEAEWERIWHRDDPAIANDSDLTSDLARLLARPNICSKERFVRTFDHEVKDATVGKPFTGKLNDGPADAAVLRPLYNSYEGMIISHGINPRYSHIDTYHMAANAVDEAIRGVIAVGGDLDRVALNDNFCWPSPLEDKHKMAQLVRANKALYDYTVEFGTPCISGKDSMTIDTKFKDENGVERKVSGLPSLLITAMGKMKDAKKIVSMDAKFAGDLVYVLGVTKDEMGGSEYYSMYNAIGDSVPIVDAKRAKRLYNALSRATREGVVASIHDCSQGGLGVALAETAFSGGLGMEVDLSKIPRGGVDKNYKALFSESASRFVATINPKERERFESMMKGNAYANIGYVASDNIFRVRGIDERYVVNANAYDLKNAWQKTFK
ncbi:MAG: phosphoribosylformylglycinamidine synthase subunit PurL [Candidatus Aenigmatarchaeota archaeon]